MKLLEVASDDVSELDNMIQEIAKKFASDGWQTNTQAYAAVSTITGNPEDVLTHMITAVAHLEINGMGPSTVKAPSTACWESKKVDGSRAYAEMMFWAAKNKKFMARVSLYVR